jgi:hypothetical protein
MMIFDGFERIILPMRIMLSGFVVWTWDKIQPHLPNFTSAENECYLSATPDFFSTFFVSAQVALMLDHETNPNSFLD